jgi:hypothetical protein
VLAFVEATPAPWATSKVAARASETPVARCASVAYPLRRIGSAKSELCTARVSVGPPAAASVEATLVVSACKAQHALHTRTRTSAESGAIGCPSSCSSGARVVIGVQREGHRGTGTTPRGLPNMDCLTWAGTGQAEGKGERGGLTGACEKGEASGAATRMVVRARKGRGSPWPRSWTRAVVRAGRRPPRVLPVALVREPAVAMVLAVHASQRMRAQMRQWWRRLMRVKVALHRWHGG